MQIYSYLNEFIRIVKDESGSLITNILSKNSFLPNSQNSDYTNFIIMFKVSIIVLVILLFVSIKYFVRVMIAICIIVIGIIFITAVENVRNKPNILDTENTNSIVNIVEDNDKSMNISFLDNVTTNDGISILSNISLESGESSDYEKLFYDTNRRFESQVHDRNSAKNITYDMGNTVEFGKALMSPILTCKEDNLKCIKYDDLKQRIV